MILHGRHTGSQPKAFLSHSSTWNHGRSTLHSLAECRNTLSCILLDGRACGPPLCGGTPPATPP